MKTQFIKRQTTGSLDEDKIRLGGNNILYCTASPNHYKNLGYKLVEEIPVFICNNYVLTTFDY